MKRLHWILLLMILLIPTESISAKKKTEKSDREIWCDVMYRMAAPVLSNMSEGLLKQNMLVKLSPTWDGRNQNVTYMESASYNSFQSYRKLLSIHTGSCFITASS